MEQATFRLISRALRGRAKSRRDGEDHRGMAPGTRWHNFVTSRRMTNEYQGHLTRAGHNLIPQGRGLWLSTGNNSAHLGLRKKDLSLKSHVTLVVPVFNLNRKTDLKENHSGYGSYQTSISFPVDRMDYDGQSHKCGKQAGGYLGHLTGFDENCLSSSFWTTSSSGLVSSTCSTKSHFFGPSGNVLSISGLLSNYGFSTLENGVII